MEPNECVKSIVNQLKQNNDKSNKYEAKRFESLKNNLSLDMKEIDLKTKDYENKLHNYQKRLEEIKRKSFSSLDQELEQSIDSLFLERFF